MLAQWKSFLYVRACVRPLVALVHVWIIIAIAFEAIGLCVEYAVLRRCACACTVCVHVKFENVNIKRMANKKAVHVLTVAAVQVNTSNLQRRADHKVAVTAAITHTTVPIEK